MAGKWILIAVIIFLSLPVHGHRGDRVIHMFEITDDRLGQIDLRDGRIDEWEDFSEPSLTSLDFAGTRRGGSEVAYDPADFDFRVWLGWNATHQRIYVSAQFVDESYFDASASDDGVYDQLDLVVDGDHSGGRWIYITEDEPHMRQAQGYRAPARNFPAPVGIAPLGPLHRPNWMDHPPYADGGVGFFGENPILWSVEFYITPFDALIWDDPDGSMVSKLEVGMVIGIDLWAFDRDTSSSEFDSYALGSGYIALGDADEFVDGLLLGAGGDIPDDSVVRSDSWGRIKASLSD